MKPKIPKNKLKFRVKKVKEFAASSSGSYPAILSSVFVDENCLLGTADALLLLQPNDEIRTIMSTPVFKVDSNDEYIFVLRGSQREFGYLTIKDFKKSALTSLSTLEGRFVPLVPRKCHTFALGKFHGKFGAAVACDETVKVFLFDHDKSAEEIHSFQLDQVPSSLIFTSTSIITGTEPMVGLFQCCRF